MSGCKGKEAAEKVEQCLVTGYGLDVKGHGPEDREEVVTDILVDLRHYCSAHGLSFEKINRLSQDHYRAEREEDKGTST